MLSTFSYVSGPSVCPPGEVSVQVFCPSLIGLFVFLKWSHVSSLCILEIKPLSEVSLANMFSHTVGSLFILVLFSLAMQKLFILMRSHLFILSFMSLALGAKQQDTNTIFRNQRHFCIPTMKYQKQKSGRLPFDTATRKIKYLGINLTKVVKE